MPVLSICGSRGKVESIAGLAVRLGGFGTGARVCAPPEYAQAERCEASVVIGMMPIGVWR